VTTILQTRHNDKYQIDYAITEADGSSKVDVFHVNVYRFLRDGQKKYLSSHSVTRWTARDAEVQYHKRIAKFIIGQDKWNLFVDEIGGFLGNRDWSGKRVLADMAKDPQLLRWASYYGAIAEDVLWALRTIQKEDGVLRGFETGEL
jgi:hypothetical protein